MKKETHHHYIGIDPDVKKSGVAYYDRTTKKLELVNLSFFELFDYLNWIVNERDDDDKLHVIIEAAWLIKADWSKSGKSSASTLIGKHIGANHETGRKIAEMCEYLGVEYTLVKPTQKKVTHEYFKKLTGIIGRTNQEQRDAAMLVWGR